MRSLILMMVASLPLAGCYYEPAYTRSGAGGDAYYGEAPVNTTVAPGFYDPGYGYGYGGYGGCCYAGGVSTVFYRDDRRYYRDRNRDHDGPHRPPPGGWNGHDGGDHRPPPGGWQGGGHRPRPPGGWHGDGRPPQHGGPQGRPSGGSRPAPNPQRSAGGGQDHRHGRGRGN